MRLDRPALLIIVAMATTAATVPAFAQDGKKKTKRVVTPKKKRARVKPKQAETAAPDLDEDDADKAGDEAPDTVKDNEEKAPDTEVSDTEPAPEAKSDTKSDSDSASDSASDSSGADATSAASNKAGDDEAKPAPETKRSPSTPITSQCTATAVASVLDKRRAALARVEAPGARGLGFVFHSRNHVMTALSLVDTGRGIVVIFDGNKKRRARVVAMDEENDLAILELDAPAPADPIPMAKEAPSIGDPVLALRLSVDFERGDKSKRHRKYLKARRRHKRWNSAETLVQPGVVTYANATTFRTDALKGQHKRWGAPLLDCKGRLVGAATSPLSDDAVGLAKVETLGEEVADWAVFRGRWSLFHPHASLVGQIDHTPSLGYDDHNKWLGFSVGTALIGHDRWYFPARFTASFLVHPGLEQPFAKRSGYRIQGSLGAGYRIMLKGGAIPVYLVPTVGGTVMYEKIKTEETQFWVDEPCPDGGCRANPFELTITESALRVMPVFGGGLQVGPVEASYQFIFDTEESERSVHQITLGVQF